MTSPRPVVRSTRVYIEGTLPFPAANQQTKKTPLAAAGLHRAQFCPSRRADLWRIYGNLPQPIGAVATTTSS
jgi:hypothetical protein